MSNRRLSFAPGGGSVLAPALSYLSHSRYGEDWNSMLHTHPITEILFMTEGTGKILFDGKTVAVRSGDLAIINPSVPHTESSNAETPLSYLVLGIDNVHFASLDMIDPYKDEALTNMPVLSAGVYHMQAHADTIKHLILPIQRELEQKKEYYETAVQNWLSLFMVFLMRNTSLVASPDSAPKMSGNCALIKRFIDSNFSYNYSLEELSAKIFVNKFHLIHIFKKYLGISPQAYILEKRITEAKQLLLKTDLNVSDICKEVGFSSANHFSQAFKKKEGVTPSAYRKQANDKASRA